MVAFEAIHDWVDAPGTVVSWEPSPATLAKVAAAPVDPTPASYMQAEHLRSWHEFAAQGVEMSRLAIATWEIPGQCDIRAMTHVINAHLRLLAEAGFITAHEIPYDTEEFSHFIPTRLI